MNRTGLLLGASAGCLLLSVGMAAAAPALPTGGTVTAGSAAISASGASMTVSQSTPKAVIDWQGFSIGQGGSVQFNNGSGSTLNRVTGTSGSSIDGLLSGTGSVYLINPNGVIVGKTGVVNVGGTFVASAIDVPNANFLSGGDLTFSGPSTASVVNAGKVGSLGGDVVLIAANVSNAGSLSAPNGTAGLLAGQSVLLRDQALDDGKFSVLTGGGGTFATNSGLIEAASAELRANGGNVYALAGNTAGVIRATGAKGGDGHVWLIADGGSLDVAGTITARGPNGSGGSIETSGAEVKIGASSIDAGVGGTWLVDPYDLRINAATAATISAALNAGTDVTEQTSAAGVWGYGAKDASGNGDIFVQAPISWSTGATLSLKAYRNLTITAPITASGAGKVVLYTGSLGNLSFGLGAAGFAGKLSFTGADGSGQSLTINNRPVSLIYSMAELAALNGVHGDYALAVDLTPSITYGSAVVGATYATIEGLGHVVHDLNITPANNTTAARYVGLIGDLFPQGSIANLGVEGGTVSGQVYVGDLVGANFGSITRSFATGTVTSSLPLGQIGGFVGLNQGTITGSFAAGAVTTANGGDNYISVGGFVGAANSGAIDHDYATGAVTASGRSIDVGGFAGSSGSGTIAVSYSTGDVIGNQAVGGFVGATVGAIGNVGIGNVYETGAVQGAAFVGGMVGQMAAGGISDSYAIGLVKGPNLGGFVGVYGNGILSGDYWNVQTAGTRGAGPSGATLPGVAGLTTAQFQSALQNDFNSVVWGLIPGESYPYLRDLFSTPPQVLSGQLTTPALAGMAGAQVIATVNGQTTFGSATTGADGSYYFMEQSGVLPAGSTVVLYAPGVSTAAAVERIGGAGATGVSLRQTYATIYTPDQNLSMTASDLASGLGPATAADGSNMLLGVSGGALSLAPGANLALNAQGANFNFNQALDLGAAKLVMTAAGGVLQSGGGITAGVVQGSSGGGLYLTAAGNQIAWLGGWTTNSGPVSLTDGQALFVTGQVNSAGSVTLVTTAGGIQIKQPVIAAAGTVTLSSAAGIAEPGSGAIVAPTLTGSAHAAVTLNGPNMITRINGFNDTGGPFSLTNGQGLLVVGSLDGTGKTVSLTTTAGDIAVNGTVKAATLNLTSDAGALAESASTGAIIAGILNAMAHTGITLASANNQITTVGTDHTDSGPNNIVQ